MVNMSLPFCNIGHFSLFLHVKYFFWFTSCKKNLFWFTL